MKREKYPDNIILSPDGIKRGLRAIACFIEAKYGELSVDYRTDAFNGLHITTSVSVANIIGDAIKTIGKSELLLELTDEELALAVMYAKNYLKYGADITEKLDTATKNAEIIHAAERYGYIKGVEEIKNKQRDHGRVKPYEMMITHNDGTVEYIADIDSLGLLASKHYDITYYGELKGPGGENNASNN